MWCFIEVVLLCWNSQWWFLCSICGIRRCEMFKFHIMESSSILRNIPLNWLLCIGVFIKPHKPHKPQKSHQNHPQNGITAPHHTAWCSAVCGFIIRKPHKPHRTAPHILYILIYLFIFNIKYIINSLITLVFEEIFFLITLESVD